MKKNEDTLYYFEDDESVVFEKEYINREFSQQINDWKESNVYESSDYQ